MGKKKKKERIDDFIRAEFENTPLHTRKAFLKAMELNNENK